MEWKEYSYLTVLQETRGMHLRRWTIDSLELGFCVSPQCWFFNNFAGLASWHFVTIHTFRSGIIVILNQNVFGLHLNYNKQHFMHTQKKRKGKKGTEKKVWNYELTCPQTTKQVYIWDSSAPIQHPPLFAIHACYATNSWVFIFIKYTFIREKIQQLLFLWFPIEAFICPTERKNWLVRLAFSTKQFKSSIAA